MCGTWMAKKKSNIINNLNAHMLWHTVSWVSMGLKLTGLKEHKLKFENQKKMINETFNFFSWEAC